jgi:hypothetical protein
VPAFVRYSRGRDVMAACGQLALKEAAGSPLQVIDQPPIFHPGASVR